MFAQFAPHHQGDQLLAVVTGNRLDANQLAVTQHGDALRHSGQFFEAMGNVDDRDATSLQPRDLLEQHFDLTRGQHCRRLVENQHVAVASEVTGDLNHLLMPDAQIANQRVRVNRVQPNLGHGLDGVFTQALTIDPARAAWQIVQKQVFGNGQGWQQVQLLHDHTHPELFGLGAIGWLVGLPLKLHAAGGGRDQPADDL